MRLRNAAIAKGKTVKDAMPEVSETTTAIETTVSIGEPGSATAVIVWFDGTTTGAESG